MFRLPAFIVLGASVALAGTASAQTTSTTTTTAAVSVGGPAPTPSVGETSVAPSAPIVSGSTSVGASMQTAETKTVWVNRPLLVTGLVLFGGTYGASAIVGAESGRHADNPNLYYPIVGPWLDLGQRGCTAENPCSAEAANKTLLILDGIGQGIGALAMVTSLFIPEKTGRHYFFLGSDKLRVLPTAVGALGYGMTAVGKF